MGEHTSLAVVDGKPAISYRDGNINGLKYVRANDAAGSNWGPPLIVDSTGLSGQGTSLAVVDGNPAIAHYDDATKSQKYVRATDSTGSSWGMSVVYDSGLSASNSPLAPSLIALNGNPAISYRDEPNGDLKYVTVPALAITWIAVEP